MGKICMRWVVDAGRANKVSVIVGSPRNLRHYEGIPKWFRSNPSPSVAWDRCTNASRRQIRGDSLSGIMQLEDLVILVQATRLRAVVSHLRDFFQVAV